MQQLICFIMHLIYSVRFFGRDISIHPSARISLKSTLRTIGGGRIIIGPNTSVHDYCMILTYGGDIAIGEDCSVNPFSVLYGHGSLTIGSGVRIACHTVIIPANHLPTDGKVPSYKMGYTAKGIVINDDVWIGAGSRILDGVSIGSHSIVGAGSVVVRSIPTLTTVAGVPARSLH